MMEDTNFKYILLFQQDCGLCHQPRDLSNAGVNFRIFLHICITIIPYGWIGLIFFVRGKCFPNGGKSNTVDLMGPRSKFVSYDKRDL